MNLMQAIKINDVYMVEDIIKKELVQRPEDIQLWMKLSLTELQYPFEDYVNALECIYKIYEISENNIDALILEAGIKWHSYGFLEEELFERLKKVKSDDMTKKAIIYYLQSLYYQSAKEFDKQKVYLKKSIMLYAEVVYPYEALGNLFMLEFNINEAKKMYNIAYSNVKKVYQTDDFYDFTDVNVYIDEYITGTAISQENYNYIKKLALT